MWSCWSFSRRVKQTLTCYGPGKWLAPQSPQLEVNADGSDYLFDDLGNALGGIRTPSVDAPSALLRGEANEGDNRLCSLLGTTSLFSAEQMASLYVDEAGFVAAVTAATNLAVEGFLLQADADAIITWAPDQWRSQTVAP
jgi:hypothetical protein